MHCATLASISKRLRPTGSFTSAIKCFLWENFTSELKRDLNPTQGNANKRYSQLRRTPLGPASVKCPSQRDVHLIEGQRE